MKITWAKITEIPLGGTAMHKSRLGTIVIDCKTDDLDRETEFWSQVLGCKVGRSSEPDEQNYVVLKTAPEEIKVLLQQVDHPSRVHIDIETDDIEAEVSRLEKIGAKRVAQIKRWWVMEAPSGHRFCVVPPQRADFARNSNEWT
jgi:predicted enzyme related to lactoylglutathione lyase